jgi:hypothetical protein
MLFAAEINVPADTSKDDPYLVVLPVRKGTVKRLIATIAVPSAWAVGFQVWHGKFQVWPTTDDQWIAGGHINLDLEENYEIDQPPLEFDLLCYNEDDQNDHKIWIGFSVLRLGVTGALGDFIGWLANQ